MRYFISDVKYDARPIKGPPELEVVLSRVCEADDRKEILDYPAKVVLKFGGPNQLDRLRAEFQTKLMKALEVTLEPHNQDEEKPQQVF